MKILFLHQNFPGQYRALAPKLQAKGHEVIAISSRKETELMGIKNITYTVKRNSAKDIQPWLTSTEAAVLRGEAAAGAMMSLKRNGFVPDVVVGHTGWGETLYVKHVFPHARLVGFCEYYYLEFGADVNFDPEFPSAPDVGLRCQTRNMHLSQSLIDCDVAITPTKFQASLFPKALQEKLTILHDGIESSRLIPDHSSWIKLGRDDITAKYGDEIITFINRNFEPMRGYHQFMRALPEIMAKRPNARVVLVGGDQVSYGAAPARDGSYKSIYFEEVRQKIDVNRIHFVGQIPYGTLVNLLRVSAAHVYFTHPFVLSWSMMEAMSLGCLLVGSKTPPVEEMITHGHNGLLVDFFNPAELASTLCEVLENPRDYVHLRKNARQHIVDNYDFLSKCLPEHIRLIEGS